MAQIPPKIRVRGGGYLNATKGVLVLGDISHQNFRILGPPPLPSMLGWCFGDSTGQNS